MCFDCGCCFVLAALFFFFQSYGDHRDLHSFPTRRSSDLLALEVLESPRRVREQETADVIGQPAVVLLGHFGIEADRKSTRLNSSHTVISYAVFCLKKKKAHTAKARQCMH